MSDSNIIYFYLWFLLSKYPEQFIRHDQSISHSRYSRKSIPTLCWQISKKKDGHIHILKLLLYFNLLSPLQRSCEGI